MQVSLHGIWTIGHEITWVREKSIWGMAWELLGRILSEVPGACGCGEYQHHGIYNIKYSHSILLTPHFRRVPSCCMSRNFV